MLAQQQPQQPEYLGGDEGNDQRSNHEIERDLRQLSRAEHEVLLAAARDYRALHARVLYDIHVLELREARTRETFDWPTPPPARPGPYSVPLAQRPQIHHLHAGRMGVIVEAEAERRRNTNG